MFGLCCRRSFGMGSNSVVDMIEASSGVHFSGFHMDSLDARIKEIEKPTTSPTEDMYKQPFVIGKYFYSLLNVDSIFRS